MSRSSEAYFRNKRMALLAQGNQVSGPITTIVGGYVPPAHAPPLPFGMLPYGQMAPPLPPGALPMPTPPTTFIPIPLTGDEDDNIRPEEVTNTVPMHGNMSNYNMNTLLHANILESEYFRALYMLKTYHEVIDEIKRSVNHVEPWQVGTSRIPSTCFCLLLKFMFM